MGKIHIMDEWLSNKIAAGEVVERPASVVKELVENSIDAHSTSIEVFLEEAGLSSIQVIDNGVGMDDEDAKKSFFRHATSKIEKEQDLFRIRTLGFRGEALASIASVSKMTLTTSDGESGLMLYLEGGHVKEEKPAPLRRGTDIKVAQLFYNTPARLKYLKTVQTELSHIIDFMNRIALGYPGIAIKLVHNGQTILQTNGRGNVQQVLAAIYGPVNAQKMIPFEGENHDYKVHGYAALPEVSRASKNYISLFVNGRWVKHYLVQKAIIDAYHTFLPIERYPLVVLYIEADPQLTDVNVHPAKHQVRLSKEPELLALIERIINSALRASARVPLAEKKEKPLRVPSEQLNIWKQPTPTNMNEAQMSERNQPMPTNMNEAQMSERNQPMPTNMNEAQMSERNQPTPTIMNEAQMSERNQISQNNANEVQLSEWKRPSRNQLDEERLKEIAERLQSTSQPVSNVGQSESMTEHPYTSNQYSAQEEVVSSEPTDIARDPSKWQAEEVYSMEQNTNDVSPSIENVNVEREPFDKIPPLEVVGQIHGTYIVAQMEDGFYLIDQHAAQERIKYEYYREKVGEVNPNERQALLLPLTFHYSADEALKLNEHRHALEEVGVFLEDFGQSSFIVREHPTWFPKGEEQEIIESLIEQVLAGSRADIKKLREAAAIMMSCKKSIKANHFLTKEQMERLIADLRQAEHPFTCPHGRPVLIHFSTYEVEKMFKRVM